MAEKQYFLVRWQGISGFSPYLTLKEVACRSGAHPELINRFLSLGLIDLAERTADGEALFETEVVSMIRKILRLRNQLGVNYAGIGVILELMDRIESMEEQIRELEERLVGDR